MAKTPSSLKWLIDKRIRLAGKLIEAEKRSGILHADLELIRGELEEAAHRLQAIDTAMGLHEIQIEPSELQAIRPRRNKPLLPHGQLSRILLRELGLRNEWVSTAELATVVIDNVAKAGESSDFVYVMHVVRNRLNGMCHQGSVIRRLQLDGRGYTDGISPAYWSLAGREAPPCTPTICRKEGNRRA